MIFLAVRTVELLLNPIPYSIKRSDDPYRNNIIQPKTANTCIDEKIEHTCFEISLYMTGFGPQEANGAPTYINESLLHNATLSPKV